MALNKELLAILVCPACRQKVELSPAEDRIICPQCRLAFPVKDDIPIMLLDQARPLED